MHTWGVRWEVAKGLKQNAVLIAWGVEKVDTMVKNEANGTSVVRAERGERK